MALQTLTLKGLDLSTNKTFKKVIKTSNLFMLALEYMKVDSNLFIEDWDLSNDVTVGGNSGINAGAFLCQYLEELTGLQLA